MLLIENSYVLLKYPYVSPNHHLQPISNSQSHFNISDSYILSSLQTFLNQASAICIIVAF